MNAQQRPPRSMFICLFLICGMSMPLSTLVHAQSFTFFHLGIENGLSSQDTGPLWQDQQGFVWVGTSNGLNRFDGYHFTPYFFTPGDSFSIPTNTIAHVYQDRAARLWIATRGGGLAYYDARLDRFYPQLHDPNDDQSLGNHYLNQIYEDHQGRLWIATDTELNELVAWNPRTKQASFKRHTKLSDTHIETMAEWPKGTLWLGTAKHGLIRYRPASNEIRRFPYRREHGKVKGPISNLIKELYVDTLGQHNALWVCTFRGLTQITLDTGGEYVFRHIRKNEQFPDRFIDNHVTSLVRDGENSLWVGTYQGGVTRLLFEEDRIRSQHFMPQDRVEQGVGHPLIRDLLFDQAGILWIAHGAGVDKVYVRHTEQNQSTFRHRRLPSRRGKPIVQDVLAFHTASQDTLLIGTYGNGLLLQTERSGQSYFFGTGAKTPTHISHDIVTAIDRDESGTYWIGTFGGFNQLTLDWEGRKPQPHFVNYVHRAVDSTSLSNDHIFALCQDGNQGYWIGTRGGGLNHFDKETKTFKAFTHQAEDTTSISNNYVWSITTDSQGYVWMATDGGVNRLDPKTHAFLRFQYNPKRPNGLSSNFVNAVYVDRQQRLWVGTNGGGITVMSTTDLGKIFWQIRTTDGLVHDEVYSILEDGEGLIWVSTSQGLSRINPHVLVEGNPIPLTAIQNFDKTDGLQDNEFNAGAHWKSQQGYLYLGGINGYNYFLPEEIRRNEEAPSVYLTEVSIFNQIVQPGMELSHGGVPLRDHVMSGQSLTLTHKDLVVTFSFSALNHLFPQNNQYAYQLVGFDEGWRYVNDERKATYTNLSPGTYTFRVKASNNDGVWNEEGTQLKVRVIPPPWRSWWAYTFYGILAMGLIYGFIRYRIAQRTRALEVQHRIEQAKAAEREQVRRHAAADYHDELGNKMTKIGLFVELARRQAQQDSQLNHFLDHIDTNAQRLSEGMRDFIWVLDPDKDTVFDLVGRLQEFAQQILTYTDLQFTIHGLDEQIGQRKLALNARRHIIMILKEALNNILKYAEAQHIRLSFDLTREDLLMALEDDGKGFDLATATSGYGLKNMHLRAEKIQANLNLSSKPGQGTRLELRIPHMGDEV